MGVSEQSFWKLTPREFDRRVRIYNRRLEERTARREEALHQTAWIVATIMNMSGKVLKKGKKVTIESLLKPNDPKAERDPAEVAADREYLIRVFQLDERFGVTRGEI